MPTPSKFEEVLALSDKEKYFQNNTFEERDSSVFSEDVLGDSNRAVVLFDKNKLQTKTVQAEEVQQGKVCKYFQLCGYTNLGITAYEQP